MSGVNKPVPYLNLTDEFAELEKGWLQDIVETGNRGSFILGPNVQAFEKEFEQDLLVIDYAVKEFGMPGNLKLSVHSGSDKFSIYPIMGRLIKKHDKGIHVKTAGTTWLEEIIGLAAAGGGGIFYW